MIRFLLSLCITWSISSWILTETYFFFPSMKTAIEVVEEWLTIPRHDEWDMHRIEREQLALERSLSRFSFSHELKSQRSPITSSSVEQTMRVNFMPTQFERFSSNNPFAIQNSSFERFSRKNGSFWWS